MLDLEYHNRIVEEVVKSRFEADERNDAIDVTCADFDGVSFHISTPEENKAILLVSCSTRCFSQLKNFNVDGRLKTVYGPLLAPAESSYDVSLKIDTANPANKNPEFYRKVALLKREILAAPFYHVFEAIDKGQKVDQVKEIRYRAEEAFYLKSEGTQLTVVFSIRFNDIDDITFSRVFLSEFADARKTIRGAPSIKFSQKDPPGEIANVRGVVAGDQQGFVSWTLFPEHFGAKKRDRTIDQTLIFRDYLHYHIKCSKAYLHQRMRDRVGSLLQVLNRAKQPTPDHLNTKQRKTFGGKNFKRQ
eukprot:CAMPEP_0170743202 /NCGR_PEP_ID=MMETSP0437-20130122/7144_1 /TAXON_ID=0 /ORGANISM="Sexangularia sp." /LENGTH=302 /DNA_ID=CAMNT_0011081859 /DNA_START=56 /DNA_END=961 /DNA_ORIENTATION=+